MIFWGTCWIGCGLYAYLLLRLKGLPQSHRLIFLWIALGPIALLIGLLIQVGAVSIFVKPLSPESQPFLSKAGFFEERGGRQGELLHTMLILTPIGLLIFGLWYFEPKDPQKCLAVQILGRWRGDRGSEGFIVQSVDSIEKGHIWKPGRFNTPFAADYVGPAILVIRKGHWTGSDHEVIVKTCPVVTSTLY